MEILMVTPELSPYARATRVGDLVSALAKALSQLEHRVTVAVPRHSGFETGGLLAARRLTPLTLPGGGEVTVLDAQLPSGAKAVLLDAPGLSERREIYGESASADASRFALLCAAASSLARQRADQGQPFDVVHLHDWTTAGLAVRIAEENPRVARVLSIHDATRRGVVPAALVEAFGAPDAAALERASEDGGVSLLSVGAGAAHAITAPSPTVAAELLDGARYRSLSAALAARATPTTGILGGLDYAVWNPATDVAVRSRFDAEDTANKGSTKTDLLRRQGLSLDLERPLVVVVVEPGPEGAPDPLERALGRILKHHVAVVVVARGGAPTSRLLGLREGAEDRFAIDESGDDATLRRACGAADLVILPPADEASATVARAAQRYGALPVARAVGAHADAIVDCDAALASGTGFLYDDPTPEALAGAALRGLAAYGSPTWSVLRRRVMRLDLSWDRPARRYVQVYKQAMVARGPLA